MKRIGWIVLAAFTLVLIPPLKLVWMYAIEHLNPRYPISRASEIDARKGKR